MSGGDNSIALTAVIGLRHVFTKNLFTIETKFSAKLGYNRMKVETQRLDADGYELFIFFFIIRRFFAIMSGYEGGQNS